MQTSKWDYLKEYAKQLQQEQYTITEIANFAIESFKIQLTTEQVRKIISRLLNNESDITVQTKVYTKPKIVGIIGDTHEPFTHKEYRDFCYEVFNKYKVDCVVHIGDEVDNHAISFHDQDPDGHSAAKEGDLAQEGMNKWYKTFPNVSVIIGNHSALACRQAYSLGLPKRFIKSYEEVWQAPKGWSWYNELCIDHVKYIHGTGCSGQNGAINLAIRSRESSVIGHIHSFGGVNYHANNNDLIFGMNVGCGIDVHAYAFEYARPFVNKPTLGCGIVIEGQEAIFVPMKLGKKYEWIR